MRDTGKARDQSKPGAINNKMKTQRRLHKISAGISLVILSLGFSFLGLSSLVNMYFSRRNGHVVLGCLLYDRSNRATLSLEPPGISRFGLAPAGSGPGVGGPPVGGYARRLQGCSGALGASPQSSILRCSIKTQGSVAFNVSYLPKLCFIIERRLVSQRAVEPLVIVVKLPYPPNRESLNKVTRRFG
jgi:hypothetical protein